MPKDLDNFDFSAIATLNKQKVVELTRPGWIDEHFNACFVGNSGTGKTHVALALGMAACRAGKRVRFFTAANLVNKLESAQKQYQLESFLSKLDKVDLLVCDEGRREEEGAECSWKASPVMVWRRLPAFPKRVYYGRSY